MIGVKDRSTSSPKLSPNQKNQVLARIREGESNKVIGGLFSVSPNTVQYYRRLVKAGVTSSSFDKRPGAHTGKSRTAQRTAPRPGVHQPYSGPTVYERGRIMVRAGRGESLNVLAKEFRVTLKFVEGLIRRARMLPPVLPY